METNRLPDKSPIDGSLLPHFQNRIQFSLPCDGSVVRNQTALGSLFTNDLEILHGVPGRGFQWMGGQDCSDSSLPQADLGDERANHGKDAGRRV